MGAFLGPTGGFLIGMPIGAFVTGWLARRLAGRAPGTWAGVAGYAVACVVGGIAVVYACGVPWLASVAKMDLGKAALAVAVFVPGDLIKRPWPPGGVARGARLAHAGPLRLAGGRMRTGIPN